MMTGTPESVTFVPISRIEILNSRDRNMKVFEEIVDNIRSIGLKKPITVTERPGDDGKVIRPVYDYSMPNVSDKVVRIIHSYTDYVNRVVWKKY